MSRSTLDTGMTATLPDETKREWREPVSRDPLTQAQVARTMPRCPCFDSPRSNGRTNVCRCDE